MKFNNDKKYYTFQNDEDDKNFYEIELNKMLNRQYYKNEKIKCIDNIKYLNDDDCINDIIHFCKTNLQNYKNNLLDDSKILEKLKICFDIKKAFKLDKIQNLILDYDNKQVLLKLFKNNYCDIYNLFNIINKKPDIWNDTKCCNLVKKIYKSMFDFDLKVSGQETKKINDKKIRIYVYKVITPFYFKYILDKNIKINNTNDYVNDYKNDNSFTGSLEDYIKIYDK